MILPISRVSFPYTLCDMKADIYIDLCCPSISARPILASPLFPGLCRT